MVSSLGTIAGARRARDAPSALAPRPVRDGRAPRPTRPPRGSAPSSRRPAQRLADVVVVGGGIIGCALARELALAGLRVTIIERGEPGREASSAAAGMLGPQAECDAEGPLLRLGLASRALYPDTVAALHEESGIDPELDRDGIVYVALDEEEETVLLARAQWQRRAGLAVERLSAEGVRALEPSIGDAVRSAVRFPDDHRLDNARLARAYAVAAVRAGVIIRAGVTVHGIRRERGRASGVVTPHGPIAAGLVVNAAGAWSAQLDGAATLAVHPVRGQMVALRLPRAPFRHAVYWRGVYLVPRRDGRLLAGSTYEQVGYDKRVTGGAVQGILERTFRVAPLLADATFADAWAGLRPGTPDNLPILGADPSYSGLYHATGHYRSGILLAPITAQLMLELIVDGAASIDLAPFAPGRFSRRGAMAARGARQGRVQRPCIS